MKKALISPQEVVQVLTEWLWDGKIWCPVYTEIPNSDRVAQVNAIGTEFEVAQPLFWVDCADDVVMDEFYYDNVTLEILPVPLPAPQPENPPQL